MKALKYYEHRLLKESPTHTKGGVPIIIRRTARGGLCVETFSGRSRNGTSSYYGPSDFPMLFGWPRVGKPRSKPPLVLKHQGRRYLRLPLATHTEAKS